MTAPTRFIAECVVDASVVIKLFLGEEDDDLAEALLQGAGSPSTAFRASPDLLHLECANILWKQARRGAISDQQARERLRDVLAFDLLIVPAAELAERALDLALQYGVSAYDGSYLALAELLDIPLVTADEALERKAAGAGVEIVLLSSLR